jgi:hypothetical protein
MECIVRIIITESGKDDDEIMIDVVSGELGMIITADQSSRTRTDPSGTVLT